MEAYRQAASMLPARLRRLALSLPPEDQARAEELRLRAGRPMSAVLPEGDRSFPGGAVSPGELEGLVEIASGASLHAAMEQLRRGYLTAPGGHRVGLCGTASLRDGEIRGLRPYSSANIRIARQFRGAAGPVLPRLCRDGRLLSTLILAPPGAGKTTLLRDIVRAVSDGEGVRPLRIALADERGELAALREGVPQLDVGARTDVAEGCPKAQCLMLLLRAMNPQVLAADEITAPEDIRALSQADGCGVTLLATAHGADRADLSRRALYRELLALGIFRRLVTIRRGPGRGRARGEREIIVEELE